MIHPSITLKHLETLLRVAEQGSFRQAAKELGTTQPNVSVRIATLEDVLGAKLFLREPGQIRLTEKGERIRAAAVRVLDEAERLVDIAGRSDLVTGKLRLGVAEVIACTWLHPFLRRLSETYPDLAVELTVDLSRTLDAELARGALDLTLQNRPFTTPADGVIELGEFAYVWVAQPGKGEGKGSQVLTNQTILTQPRHTEAFIELESFLVQKAVKNARLAPSSSVVSCAQMVRDGLGVALLPQALVAEDLAAGTLHRLNVGWVPHPLSFAARYRRDSAARHVGVAARIARDVSRS